MRQYTRSEWIGLSIDREEGMTGQQTNWAGNVTFSAARLHRPRTVEQVQELVARARKVKVLGTRHSFNPIADTPEDLVSLEHLNRVVAVDPDARTVTVEAGIRYGELGRHLAREGWALHNLASLPHISVGGACATATHGSGENWPRRCLPWSLSRPMVKLPCCHARKTLSSFQGPWWGSAGWGWSPA